MKKVTLLILLCISLNGFAHRILITGKPTELVAHVGYFTLPDDYVQKGRYHFITLARLVQVCYIHDMPQLDALPRQIVIIEEQGVKVPWTCYTYDPHFFEIDY